VKYQHDVFISYSQHDRPWARKLYDDLTARKLKVYFDKERLDVGTPWETSLKENLYASRSLIVVWTDANARLSDWVSRERSAFWLLPDLGDKRAHISLNLQGRPQADGRLQGIEDLLAAGVDWQQIATLDPALWQTVIDRIVRSLSRALVAMPVVALTVTRQDIAAFRHEDWRDIQAHLGLSQAEVTAMYGETRADWKPLGGHDTIAALLARLEDRINTHITGPASTRYFWELAPDAFWTDPNVAESFAATLTSPSAPSLLVIDPIAIRNRDVLDRLYLFEDSIALRHIAILVLAPFVMPSASQMLRKWLMDNAVRYFRPMFKPPIPPKTVIEAQCALYSGDEDELLRLTWSAVGRGWTQPEPTQYLIP
jgi:hypothetical protein